MTESQKPTVGRIVHYVAFGTPGGEYAAGAHRAAIITEAPPDGVLESQRSVVGLCVLNPTGMFFNQRVPFDQTGTTPGSWHWAERV